MQSNVCRLCIVKIEQNFFATIDDDIYTRIQMHLNIDVKKNDMSSSSVCFYCVEKVNEFHEYYQQVQDNQKKLLSIMNQDEFELPKETAKFETITLETKHRALEYDDDERNILDKNKKQNTKPVKKLKNKKDKLAIERNKNKQDSFSNKLTIRQTRKSQTKNMTVKEEINNLNNSESYYESQRIENKSHLTEHNKKQTKRNRKIKLSSPSKELVEDKYTDSKIEVVTNLKHFNDSHILNNLKDDNNDIRDKPDNENSNSKPFPEVVYKNGKLLIGYRKLRQQMERFFMLICNICPVETTAENSVDTTKFSTLNSLFSHYQDVHGVDGYVLCCGKTISRKNLPYHFAFHVNPEEFKCKKCDYNTDKRLLLKLHEKKHVSDLDREKFCCSLCNRTYLNAFYLKMHQAEVHPNKDQEMIKFQCKDCGISYHTQYNLKRHYIRTHSEKTLICDNCGMKFRKKSELKYHQLDHSAEKNFHCEICNKWFSSNYRLKKHSRGAHPLINIEHKCDQCEYKTFKSETLKIHKRMRHTNERPYSCQYCDRKFKTSSNLKEHSTQHTGIKVQCDFCPKEFLTKSNYYAHRKKVHYQELMASKMQQQ